MGKEATIIQEEQVPKVLVDEVEMVLKKKWCSSGWTVEICWQEDLEDVSKYEPKYEAFYSIGAEPT